MTTTNPSNPDTRKVVDHWLERMADVEGTIHRNNGTVVLLISGKEIEPGA